MTHTLTHITHKTASTAEQISPVSTKPLKQPPTATKTSSVHHASVLPHLKQKTGIVKSKVPPPVPPRGSPKDRRGGKQQHLSGGGSNAARFKMGTESSAIRDDKNAGSHHVTTSSGYLRPPFVAADGADNDDCVEAVDYYTPDGVEIVPKFGERRSPSCVDDWLELNHLHNVQTTQQIRIQTKCLQREISFPAIKPQMTVPSMIQSFSSPTIRLNANGSAIAAPNIGTSQNCVELENLRKSSSVSNLLATTFKNERKTIYTPRTPKQTLIKRTTKRRAPRPQPNIQRCT